MYRLLEYRSIDQAARSRRNNLIFCGHVEVAGNDEPEAIIRTLLADNVDIHGVCIQGAIGWPLVTFWETTNTTWSTTIEC